MSSHDSTLTSSANSDIHHYLADLQWEMQKPNHWTCQKFWTPSVLSCHHTINTKMLTVHEVSNTGKELSAMPHVMTKRTKVSTWMHYRRSCTCATRGPHNWLKYIGLLQNMIETAPRPWENIALSAGPLLCYTWFFSSYILRLSSFQALLRREGLPEAVQPLLPLSMLTDSSSQCLPLHLALFCITA